jgi:hypothetical protein
MSPLFEGTLKTSGDVRMFSPGGDGFGHFQHYKNSTFYHLTPGFFSNLLQNFVAYHIVWSDSADYTNVNITP